MADISITPASVLVSGTTATINRSYNFGATITAGQVVYLDTATSTWKLADQNLAAAGNGLSDTRGIALCGGSSGQPAAVCTLDTAGITIGATVVNGASYYLSDTAGGITATLPTTGDYPVFLGLGIGTTKIGFNPTATGVIV